ncbi:GNAT family N-acetyltransferase [Paraburkholderia kururiensis]|uniref:GNAT family N-acetyltransferase n=1 Tax=Paraburkholderia kururiensis TaxID=984307 RepID=UPI0003479B05|nr:GNAT family N-acetyltransferase [Paraburkholderia kururiensis]
MNQERFDYRTGILDSPLEVGRDEWNALLARQAQPTPFLRHEFLAALHETHCAVADTGWAPRFVTLTDASTNRLAAAAPVYLKGHSYGEYVFDWAWADAYKRNGLEYYPKLLCAVPFTPVQGTRLLATDESARRHLAATLVAFAEQADVSSLHVLFPTADEAQALADVGTMLREGVQFHWINAGYRDFDDFLSTLEQKKRKNIRAERRKVHEAGVTFRRVRGEDATDAEWRFFNRCYRQTYREHCSTPYLNLDFFRRIGETMPENLLLVIAERDGKPIASSLVVYQRGETDQRGAAGPSGTLYGRYWGALEHVPCLHFETAYYQPLEFCIEEKLATFEGGAQGEHKMARGFLPTATHSAHWLAHPAFADAVARFLSSETETIHAYVDELREHNPFRS